MVYCVNCGVELAPSECKCPLCGTSIVQADLPPEALPFYPQEEPRLPAYRVERHSLLVLLTVVFALPIALCFLCDFKLHGQLEWAGFVAACLVLVYITVIIPITLRPSILLQLAIDWAGVELLLFYIARSLKADWFEPFAFPVALFPCAAAAILILLRKKARWSGLDIGGLACLAAGIYCAFLEARINAVFLLRNFFAWAQYPFFTLLAVAFLLFVAGRNRRIKEKLARRFFI
ncbi:MAG: hypothetical protein HFF09_04765 [Oscillospiraceae bacterium]|nr:hypothetical protein [Oscillospiraceae bacterium]